MFYSIPKAVTDQMQRLEAADARDRTDGTPRLQRLRQIPPETGRFLAILAASSPGGTIIEIGTSAGYSTLYLALAAREIGARVVTFELLPDKAALAENTFDRAAVTDVVELIALRELDGSFSRNLHRSLRNTFRKLVKHARGSAQPVMRCNWLCWSPPKKDRHCRSCAMPVLIV